MNTKSGIVLGKIIFDPNRYCLLKKDGTKKQLQPIQVKLLNFFIERHGSIISREEIIREVWGNRLVSDSTLNSTFSRLRKELNCNGKVIKTYPKMGYSLSCSIEYIDIENIKIPVPSKFNDERSSVKHVLKSFIPELLKSKFTLPT